MILDATLPDIAILQKWYPAAEVAETIDVAMPHVRTRQILGVPVTKRKLLSGAGRNLDGIVRYILKRWTDIGRRETLVIAQKGVKEALVGRFPKQSGWSISTISPASTSQGIGC